MRRLLCAVCLILVPSALAQDSEVADTIKKLSDPEQPVRNKAISAILTLGPKAKAAVPELVNILKTDAARANREAAIYALGAIGPDAKEAVPHLVSIAKGGQGELGKLYEPAKGMRPFVESIGQRQAAIATLGKIKDPEAVTVLVAYLVATEKGDQVHGLDYYRVAALALGEIGRADPKAIEALKRGQKLPDKGSSWEQARIAADTALRKIEAANK